MRDHPQVLAMALMVAIALVPIEASSEETARELKRDFSIQPPRVAKSTLEFIATPLSFLTP